MRAAPWIEVGQVDSTNRLLAERARRGAVHGTAVLAETQTAGRGRLGRSWEAAPGEAVLLSVLVRRPLPAARVPLLTLGVAVAAAEVVEGLRIKWPNDLLAPDGHKVGGILAEAEFAGSALDHAVLGIGLNVHGAPDLPQATCLARAFPGRALDRVGLARAIRDRILVEVEGLCRDPAPLLERWRRRAHTLGRRVRIGAVEGVAVDVDPGGALLVRTANGPRRVVAGDVEMVAEVRRPPPEPRGAQCSEPP